MPTCLCLAIYAYLPLPTYLRLPAYTYLPMPTSLAFLLRFWWIAHSYPFFQWKPSDFFPHYLSIDRSMEVYCSFIEHIWKKNCFWKCGNFAYLPMPNCRHLPASAYLPKPNCQCLMPTCLCRPSRAYLPMPICLSFQGSPDYALRPMPTCLCLPTYAYLNMPICLCTPAYSSLPFPTCLCPPIYAYLPSPICLPKKY